MNNDRFKFRVWDNLRKSYDNLETMYLEQHGGLCYPLPNAGMTAPDEDCEYTIEQCTGLRDRNGKLIYEGDVLGNDDPLEITVVRENVYWGYYTDGGFHALPYWVDKLEIVGNIHGGGAKTE